MGDMASDVCLGRFESFVGRDYETSELDIFTMYPTSESWAQKDREGGLCGLQHGRKQAYGQRQRPRALVKGDPARP